MAETPPTTQAAPVRRKTRLRRILRSAVLITVAAYVAFVLLIYLFQGRILYSGDRVVRITLDRIAVPYEDLTLQPDDGVHLAAWYVPARESRGTVIFCHGNGGNMGNYLNTVLVHHSLGLNVLIFDYRGYGESEGETTEEGTYKDAEAAWRYLVEDRRVPPESIILHGRSLGGSIAAWLAERHHSRALILESSFTSFPDRGQQIMPFVPMRLIARFQYNTLEAVEKVTYPVLVIHSRQDETIPFSHAERLYEAAAKPKTLLEIHGSHNNGPDESEGIYVEGIRRFLGLK
jgi:uncharacterized protein